MAQVGFDKSFYRRSYPDLAKLADNQLLAHYITFGIAEGRMGSPLACREHLVETLRHEKTILEIGPFLRPVVTGDNVEYFDVLDTEGLRHRARSVGYQEAAAPHIHHVSPTGDLGVVRKTFSAVVSSHCVEHQPDLVQHLQDVARVLVPGGKYYLLIPDKRYCFDHFIAPSTIADVLDAHWSKRRSHTLRSVVEHRALTTHNDAVRHWRGDHAEPDFDDTIIPRVHAALVEMQRMAGAYIDVHAWQFTPSTFRTLCGLLRRLDISPLVPEAVFETPFGRNEFTAILVNPASL